MIRWALWVIATATLGLAVHLASLLLVPYLAKRDADHRVAALGAENQFRILPRATPDTAVLPLPDASVTTAVCRYDLSKGPLQIRAPVVGGFFALSFYTPDALNFYSLTDRAATNGVIELKLFTPAQLAEVRSQEGPDTPASLRVEAPTARGLATLRAIVPEGSQAEPIETVLKTAICSPLQP